MSSIRDLLKNMDLNNPNSKDLLVKMLQDRDPELATVYHQLQQQMESNRQDEVEMEDAEIYDEVEEELISEFNELADQLEETSQALKAATDENELLRTQVEKHIQLNKLQKKKQHQMLKGMHSFARAVGACPRCLGMNAECELCYGMGKAGYMRPDPHLFSELVEPALPYLGIEKNAKDHPFH